MPQDDTTDTVRHAVSDLGRSIARLMVTMCVFGACTGAVSPLERTLVLAKIDTPPSYVISAAYPIWRTATYPPEVIPLDHLSWIDHCFVLPGKNGELSVPPGFLQAELVERVHAADRKIILGVGGEGSQEAFSPIVADPVSRAAFVENLVDFVVDEGYDGVTIDWEFPETLADRENLSALMIGLRTGLDARDQALQLNIAVPSSDRLAQWIDAEAITPLADYYIVMAFASHGDWSTESGHNAPLYAPPLEQQHPVSVNETIRYWTETRGVPPSKILMGLAFFGISFDSEGLYRPFSESGQARYSGIRPLIGNGYTRRWDSACEVPYLTQDVGPTLWSYDDPLSIDLKCKYVIQNNLAGVAIWDITMDLIDDRQELLETAATKLMPAITGPRISLTVVPDRTIIHAGRSATFTVLVTAGSCITDPITLTPDGLPLGVSAAMYPNSVIPPGTSLLEINNTNALSAATYPITVTGVYNPLSLYDSVSVCLTVASPRAYLPLIRRQR
jgi:chitinase